MAFQSTELVAAALSVPDGSATHGRRLPEGVHLRWAFQRARGFPWGGFYVFWRHHIRELNLLSAWLRTMPWKPGPIGTTHANISDFGAVSSDADLHLGMYPPGSGVPVFDLSGRSWLRFAFPAGEPVHHVTSRLYFEANATITVRAMVGSVPVAQQTVSGQAGDLRAVAFDYDAVTAVEFRSGQALLVDLHVAPVDWYAGQGWQEFPGVSYPLCLPVAHPDYPIPEGVGALDEAWQVARKRVAPGGDTDPIVAAVDFKHLHEQLRVLVEGGPGSEPMEERVHRIVDSADPNAKIPPAMLQRALDLVLLSSLEPVVAQMLGLYLVHQVDRTEHAFDYLVVADHGNPPNYVREAVRKETSPRDLPDTDSYITYGHRPLEAPPPLKPPADTHVYALPDAGVRADESEKKRLGRNRAGIRWDLGYSHPTAFWPDRPALFRLWRAEAGRTEPDGPPALDTYEPVHESPIVSARPVASTGTHERPEGWPDLRLQSVDSGLKDGWYSYRVSGIDLFGRHSPPGDPGGWYQWEPPGDPPPWYYQNPPGYRQLHPFAACLLDDAPPPPPTEVAAQALDPKERKAWRETLDAHGWDPVVGLSVRWSWPEAHALQAPDIVQFRIHYQPGMLNVLRGRAVSVSPAAGGQSRVVTDIADNLPADAYAGGSVRIGEHSFRVAASASSPLELHIHNIGPSGDVAPQPGTHCALALHRDHPRYVDFSRAVSWQEHYYTVGYSDHVTVEQGGDGWVRRYEITLPRLDGPPGPGLPLAASVDEPIAYAHVGVTAVRDTPEPVQTADPSDPDPWPGSESVQLESSVSKPTPIYVVLRDKPTPPTPPPADGDGLLATRADYHGHSYFTYRWTPQPHLKTHVYRALDEAVFAADRRHRQPLALDPDDAAQLEASGVFPSEPGWDHLRRAHVATQIKALDQIVASGDADEIKAAYKGLSNDAVRVLAGLPGNEHAFTQRTIDPFDPGDPASADRRGPDDPDDYQPDSALRCYVDELDGRSSNRYLYRAAYVDPAHNRSALSLASPPVSLPKVAPPRTPTVTRVTGGDRQVTLAWASSREPDLAAYRVCRAGSERDAADLRLMTVVHTEAVPGGDPGDRPAELVFTDTDVPTYADVWYRVAAVDSVGNVSRPSVAVTGRAYDYGPPAEPDWERSEWVKVDADGATQPWTDAALAPAIALRLRVAHPRTTALLQRRDDDGGWRNITGWQHAGDDGDAHGWTLAFLDLDASPDREQHYRAKLQSLAGITLESGVVRTVPAPPTGEDD